MHKIKNNFRPNNIHRINHKLIVNNRYNFESVVLLKYFNCMKYLCAPLLISNIDTLNNAVLARLLCILSNKIRFKGILKLNKKIGYLYAH